MGGEFGEDNFAVYMVSLLNMKIGNMDNVIDWL